VRTTESKAAAAARIGAALGRRKSAELLELLRPCFARTEPWLQAGRYAAAVMSPIPRRNGWTIAAQAGDWAPDKTRAAAQPRGVGYVRCPTASCIAIPADPRGRAEMAGRRRFQVRQWLLPY